MNEKTSRENFDDSIEYQECFVAFLDILGFSIKCEKKELSCSEIYMLLSINRIINEIAKHQFLQHIIPEDITDNIYYSIMSDSIFIASPASNFGLLYLLYLCSIIQNMLLENNMLLRGGITKGEFFGQDDIVFGPAVIEAYKIERDISRYPRIVLSKGIIDEMKLAGVFKKKTVNDYILSAKNPTTQSTINSQFGILTKQSTNDSLYFVNYLNPFQIIKINKDEDLKNNIEKTIAEGLKEQNTKIKEKYEWLNTYYNKSLTLLKPPNLSSKEIDEIARMVKRNEV